PLPPPMDAYVRDVVLCPPLGLGYIASTLIADGFEVRIVDAAIENLALKDIQGIIRRENPQLLGVSAATYTYKNALKIARAGKEVDGSIFTVLGGPHVTFRADDALREDAVDGVVRGEAEYTLLDLVRVLVRGGKLSRIAGFSFKLPGGRRIHNIDRPLIRDLDSLPFPARESLPLNLYRIPGSIITSRGCPYNCIFCAAKALSGGTYRVRSPENVVAEVKDMLKIISPEFLFIADDTFTVFHDRTKKIAERFKEIGLRWVCESRVNTVDREVIDVLAESGCFSIQFGVESGSQKILDSIGKGITIEQVRKVVKWCLEAGIQPVCSFMVPHPEDTWETVEETERFMEELRRLGVQLFVSLTTPFPGTALYEKASEFGLRFLTDDTDNFNLASTVIETKNFTAEDIEKIFSRFVDVSVATLPEALR
ncbi:MAG: B12-binding domain-containing radical SAM protein, partial [Candidatus Bathyarchaeia archaeon]